MYNFDFNNYPDAYLYLSYLENQFCKMPTHHLWELIYPKQQKGVPKS